MSVKLSGLDQRERLRDWSLITGREATKWEEGGKSSKAPTKKRGGGGGRISFSHAEGRRGTTSFQVVLMQAT